MRILLSMLALCALVITGCSSDSDSGTTPNTPSTSDYYMKATINGQPFTATPATLGVSVSEGAFAIVGSTLSPYRSISIGIAGGEAGQTYSFGMGQPAMATYGLGTTVDKIYSTSFFGGSGSITITKIESTFVEGTFTFTCSNTSGEQHTVTNGSFRIKRTE
jgi:hypothetical protein